MHISCLIAVPRVMTYLVFELWGCNLILDEMLLFAKCAEHAPRTFTRNVEHPCKIEGDRCQLKGKLICDSAQ